MAKKIGPACLAHLALCFLAPSARTQDDAENLRPGVLATYHDSAKPAPAKIHSLEPIIALFWNKDETAHPRLQAGGEKIEWNGFLKILRGGEFRFRVKLRGQFRLLLNEKEILKFEAAGATSQERESLPLRLEAGYHALRAEFIRIPGRAQVELLWQSNYFRMEPVPHTQFGHDPQKLPAQLVTDEKMEQGRLLAEELNCVRCHAATTADRIAAGLSSRQAPDLSQVGSRTHSAWIYRWLESPQKLRPGATMPRMFPDTPDGQVERQAVAAYLASLGGPVKPESRRVDRREMQRTQDHGRQLFSTLGCLACHSSEKGPKTLDIGNPVRQFPIENLGNKTTASQLTKYLANPLAVAPSGRMPHMMLHGDEPRDLARYLCQQTDNSLDNSLPAAPNDEQLARVFRSFDSRPEELTSFKASQAKDRLISLGKLIVIDKGCNNCHTIAPGGMAFANVYSDATFADITSDARQAAGCLATSAAQRGKAPAFQFDKSGTEAIRLFLKIGTSGAGSAAPAYSARIAMQRFNCFACHSRNGAGGLSPSLTEELRRMEKAENSEAISPPPLTGAGHKLRTPWIREVLVHGGRARPWMGLRMPQFGEANLGKLPEAIAAMEGIEPDDQIRPSTLNTAKISAGRDLIGKSGFGCISCHDIAGISNTGTRGPDMALMNQRVRYDWYVRWLEQAQRMQPGTRMPTVFADGKSLMPGILGGHADAQADAMWAYLSLGRNLPLPAGLEPPKGLTIVVKDRPVLLRTFMPDAGSRAIALGFPGGISCAFDAATCRLAYGWSGNFLDATPVWDGRGGNPANLLGTKFWSSPPGCPIAITPSTEPPHFLSRALDPAYGASLPEGQIFTGTSRLQFDGYANDKSGIPTFHYRLWGEGEIAVEVRERAEPLRRAIAEGLSRQFTLKIPPLATTWLLVGVTRGTPTLIDGRGAIKNQDWKSSSIEIGARGHLLALPQENERLLIIELAAGPNDTHLILRRTNGTWQAMLQIPLATEAVNTTISYRAWVLPKNDLSLLKEFVAGLK